MKNFYSEYSLENDHPFVRMQKKKRMNGQLQQQHHHHHIMHYKTLSWVVEHFRQTSYYYHDGRTIYEMRKSRKVLVNMRCNSCRLLTTRPKNNIYKHCIYHIQKRTIFFCCKLVTNKEANMEKSNFSLRFFSYVLYFLSICAFHDLSLIHSLKHEQEENNNGSCYVNASTKHISTVWRKRSTLLVQLICWQHASKVVLDGCDVGVMYECCGSGGIAGVSHFIHSKNQTYGLVVL